MITTIFVLSAIATISLSIVLVCLIGYRFQQVKATLPQRSKVRAPEPYCAQCTAMRKNLYTDVSQQLERERRFSWERIKSAYVEITEWEKIDQ